MSRPTGGFDKGFGKGFELVRSESAPLGNSKDEQRRHQAIKR